MFGMSWVRIIAFNLYVCACYLPHGSSSYLKHENRQLDAVAHSDSLRQSVSKFSALGEVLISGDLNARTACTDDRCDSVDMQEWEGLGAANLPIPCDTINVHA